jgi:D-tyrosyl-tRNA(Tyr) deacylase
VKAVIQRVKFARVKVQGETVAEIGHGLLVLLGIGKGDGEQDIHWLANKIVNLRIFEDEEGRFNYSLMDIGGEMLLVSQFTLYADCRKGRRPSFDLAMQADEAEAMFTAFFNYLKAQGIKVQKGIFGERMEIELLNYGPVTIILDSKER